MLDRFADELREKREQSGITLQQMANRTKIDLKFLEAIDEGNFAFLPELYVKAFIKQYAKEVGLDESLTIKRYETARDGRLYEKEPETEPVKSDVPAPEKPVSKPPVRINTAPQQRPLKSYNDPSVEKRHKENDPSNKYTLLIITAVIGILIILLGIYILFIRDSREIIVAERPIEEIIQENRQRYVEDDPVIEDSAVIPASDSLYLKFVSSESSWIFVVIDNAKTEEFTLAPNVAHVVAGGKNFKATIGNSGGVKLTLNNNPVEFAGRTGSVRHFSLDREGLQYLNTPPKLDR